MRSGLSEIFTSEKKEPTFSVDFNGLNGRLWLIGFILFYRKIWNCILES